MNTVKQTVEEFSKYLASLNNVGSEVFNNLVDSMEGDNINQKKKTPSVQYECCCIRDYFEAGHGPPVPKFSSSQLVSLKISRKNTARDQRTKDKYSRYWQRNSCPHPG